MFTLSPTPLEKLDLDKDFHNPAAGAFNCFEGVVRDYNEGKKVLRLEYEAVAGLCRHEAEKIYREALEQFSVIKMKCVHRTGKLEVGEIAVWVGVLAAHRDDAFQACRYIIDEVKKRLPIWKKEYYVDGRSEWVNCRQCAKPEDSPGYYSRQINLPEIGVSGQNKLREAKVCVVGAGGLGTAALTSLVSAGVGTIGICEYDVLEENNLHRQSLYNYRDAGKPKIELAVKRLKAINPSVALFPFPEKLDTANVMGVCRAFDIVLDCTDNFKTKFLLNDAAYLSGRTLVQAGIYRFDGEIRTVVPQKSACLRCLWPEIPDAGCVGTCTDTGVLGAVVQIMGHWQAAEALKIILGIPADSTDHTIFLDVKTNEIKKIKRVKVPSCPLCGEHPQIRTISVEQYDFAEDFEISLAQLNAEAIPDYIFIDVRESSEISLLPVSEVDCIQYPFSKLQTAPLILDQEKEYILFCSNGGRSLTMTKQLHARGIRNTRSLAGGVKSIKHYFLQKKIFARSRS